MKKLSNAQFKSRILMFTLCLCTSIGAFIGYNAPSAQGTMLFGDMSWLTAIFGGVMGLVIGLVLGLALSEFLVFISQK